MKKIFHLLILIFIMPGLSAQYKYDEKVEKGIASRFLYDKNVLSDSAVLFASGFENDFDGWNSFNPKVSEILSIPDSAFSGQRVLKSTATRGINTGGDVVYKIEPARDCIFLRFYTKFDKNTIMPHHFAKIYAMPGGLRSYAGSKPPGDKAFWTGLEPTDDQTWYFYSYWHEMKSWQSREGKPDGRPNPYYGNSFRVPGQSPFKKGEWICVEFMLKANTPGKYDGEQAFWINGIKTGHWKTGEPNGNWRGDRFVTGGENPLPFEGYNWRTTDEVKIDHIILRWYISREHMEKKKATHDDNSVYFDNIVVATEYIGPMFDEQGAVVGK